MNIGLLKKINYKIALISLISIVLYRVMFYSHHPVTGLFVFLFLGTFIYLYKKNKTFYLALLSFTVPFWIIYFRLLVSPGLISGYNNDFFLYSYKVFTSQFSVFFLFFYCCLLLSFIRNRVFKFIVFCVLFLASFIIIFDVFSYSIFSVRLSLVDVWNFKSDALRSISIILDFIKRYNFFVICFIFIEVGLFLFWKSKASRKLIGLVFGGAVLINLILVACPAAPGSIYDYIFYNVLSVNNGNFLAEKKYSENYEYNSFIPSVQKIEGLNKRKNVIVLFVESLSADQSKFFNGTHDNLKQLDDIAKNNIAFVNYYSNSFNTNTGNTAFLSSTPYVYGPNSNTDSWLANSFVNNLSKHGYKTKMVYSAEDIGGLTKIWEKTGFEEFIDGNDDFYKNSERLVFNSVPDLDMYENILKHQVEWNKAPPYFCMVMTTSSHAPFILSASDNSKGGVKDYERCIRYVDDTISTFYNKLKENGFFENGTLIITADHRAMTPFSAEEFNLHGEVGYSRVPLIIVDKDLPQGVYFNKLSHSSLGGIIEYLCLDEVLVKDFNSVPFIPEYKNSNQTIYYQYSAPRNKVSVSFGNNDIRTYEDKSLECNIQLNGDLTDFESECSSIDKDEKIKILKMINYFRR